MRGTAAFQPDEKPMSFGTAAGLGVRRQAAEIAHPHDILSAQLAMKGFPWCRRRWNGWPHPMDQSQKHVDSGGVRSSPIRHGGPWSSAAVLLKEPQFILQVQTHVRWIYGLHRGMPLIEIGQEPRRYSDAPPRRFRRISLLLQMLFELD